MWKNVLRHKCCTHLSSNLVSMLKVALTWTIHIFVRREVVALQRFNKEILYFLICGLKLFKVRFSIDKLFKTDVTRIWMMIKTYNHRVCALMLCRLSNESIWGNHAVFLTFLSSFLRPSVPPNLVFTFSSFVPVYSLTIFISILYANFIITSRYVREKGVVTQWDPDSQPLSFLFGAMSISVLVTLKKLPSFLHTE